MGDVVNLTNLPFEFMRGQADFEPTFSSNYAASGESSTDRWRAAHLELPEATERVESNLAAGAFLELLDRLRDVLLQVAIISCFRSLLYYPFHDLICRDFGLIFIFFYPQDAALLRREFP